VHRGATVGRDLERDRARRREQHAEHHEDGEHHRSDERKVGKERATGREHVKIDTTTRPQVPQDLHACHRITDHDRPRRDSILYDRMMSWLFGDSSASPLETNYIELLRLAIDFAVEVVQAEERMDAARERGHRLEADADVEVAKLEALGADVAKTLEASRGAAESAATRCAGAIERAAGDAVKSEIAQTKTTLAAEQAKLDAERAQERQRCVKALERLMLRYDLPDSETSVVISTAGQAYAAKLRSTTPFGLVTTLQLEIPQANLFAHDVRIDRLLEGLEVRVPETGGWLRKQSRIVPHKLGKYRIAGLTSSKEEVKLELRASADAHAAGFDVRFAHGAARLSAIGKDVEAHEPFEPDANDTAKLQQLLERLSGALAELMQSRRALVDAQLDGALYADATHPTTLVERLIAAMTPTVRAIAQHSSSPSELVLRRLLAGDRREEVFVSKAELMQKIDPLPPARRALFDTLGLVGPRVGAAGSKPPPLPGIRATTEPVDSSMVIDESSGKLRASSEPPPHG
jgi:hypothetical protein